MRQIDDKFVSNAAAAGRAEGDDGRIHAEPGIVPTPFTTLLVNTGSKLVLIDTGTGGQLGATAGSSWRTWPPPASIRRAIDTILISHFHPDHINGIKDKDGKLVFPNAEILVPAAEWAFWMDDANMSAAPDGRTTVFLNVRRIFRDIADEVTRFEPGKEVAPGITSMRTRPATRPATPSSRSPSGNQSMMVLGDTTNNPGCSLRNPEWQGDSTSTARWRSRHARSCSTALAADRCWCTGYHFPFPACGHIVKTAHTGYDLRTCSGIRCWYHSRVVIPSRFGASLRAARPAAGIGTQFRQPRESPLRSIDNAAATLHSTRLRCAVPRLGRPKGNPVRFAAVAANRSRNCPRNCERRALLHDATGVTREGGEGQRPASQETCLRQSPFRCTGRAIGAASAAVTC